MYIILKAFEVSDLVKKVNDHIDQGFLPCGGIIKPGQFYQAMYKGDKNDLTLLQDVETLDKNLIKK